jgi:hypothetical protein
MYYSWTGGFQLEKLDSIETLGAESAVYDEVWFDVRSSSLALERVAFRAYMSSRSRYYIDAFFHLAAQASNAEARASTGIGRYSASRLKDMLRERLAKVMACLVTGQTSLGALQDLKSPDTASQRVGFVGVGLTKEIGEKFIEGLRIAPGLAAEGPAGGSSDIEALMRMVLAQRAQREKGEDEQ